MLRLQFWLVLPARTPLHASDAVSKRLYFRDSCTSSSREQLLQPADLFSSLHNKDDTLRLINTNYICTQSTLLPLITANNKLFIRPIFLHLYPCTFVYDANLFSSCWCCASIIFWICLVVDDESTILRRAMLFDD